MAKLVDANLIIRFLLNDTPKQAEAAGNLFENSEELFLTDLTIAEVVWVLTSVYNLPKVEIVEKLKNLMKLSCFICDIKLLSRALIVFRNYGVSFVDAYLVAYAELNKSESIYSFDRGLDKIPSIKREEP